jgi:hypothetical protein
MSICDKDVVRLHGADRAAHTFDLALAGSRPAARNAIDARVIAGIKDGSERIIDNENSIGGWPTLASTMRSNAIPISTATITDAAALSTLGDWLCQPRKAVEGRDGDCD